MLVPSRVDRRTAIGRRIHATLERFGLKVGPAIRQRSAHIEAFEAGAWIGVHAPGSPAHREIRVLKDRVLELFDEMLPPPRPQSDPYLADAAPALSDAAPALSNAAPALGEMPRPARSLASTFFGRLGA
jgi:hypothetical protein